MGYGADVGVVLRRMRDDEFADWLPRAREDYADDMTRNSGADPQAARAKAIHDSELLFPGGLPSAEQLVFVIEADGERVGDLWLAERDGEFGAGCSCGTSSSKRSTAGAGSAARRCCWRRMRLAAGGWRISG